MDIRNERRASFAARLANAVKRRSDAENELMEELQAVEEKMADGLGDVMDMLEDSRRAVCGE